MNYVSILAMTLGMISVIITLQFIKYYDIFSKKLTKLDKTCKGTNRNLRGLIKIQNALDLSDDQIDLLFLRNSDAIATLLKNIKNNVDDTEEFTNYIYVNQNDRDINYSDPSINIKSPAKNLCKIKTYEDDIQIAKNSIENQKGLLANKNEFNFMGYQTTPSKYGLIF